MIKIYLMVVCFSSFCFYGINVYAIDGKSLFFTQKAKADGKTCVDCHCISCPDTFFFNPSAYDLAMSIKDSLLLQDDFFLKINESYLYSSRIAECHEGYNLSADTLTAIMHYLAGLKGSHNKMPSYPDYTLIMMTGGPLLLIILLFLHLKFRVLKGTLLCIAVIITLIGFSRGINELNYRKGYSPDQPIKFSHRIHAGENKINCLFCHYSARQSKTAGIPSAALCMNCHLVIREGKNSGGHELKKLFQAWDSAVPLEWIKVNDLPVFAKFSHAGHLRHNKTDCIDCHGNVENMHRIVQTENLSMNWCIDCHSGKHAGYDKTLAEIRYRLTDVNIERNATNYKINCMKCHH